MASQEIEALSQALARLPGLGPRSARRAVLHLMKKRETALQPLLAALAQVADKLSTCSICGNVDTSDPCSICARPAPRRQDAVRGRGGRRPVGARPLAAVPRPLSRARRPPVGARRRAARGPQHRPARRRASSAGGIDEVVLAMNATLEGQTTAHYLAERLEALSDPPQPVGARTSGRRRARLSRRRHARPGASGTASDRSILPSLAGRGRGGSTSARPIPDSLARTHPRPLPCREGRKA